MLPTGSNISKIFLNITLEHKPFSQLGLSREICKTKALHMSMLNYTVYTVKIISLKIWKQTKSNIELQIIHI